MKGLFIFAAILCLQLAAFADTWLDNLVLPEYPSVVCGEPVFECPSNWVDLDYLHWQVKASPRIVPLVITGIFDANVTPTIKTAGTSIVLGDQSRRQNGHSGVKFLGEHYFGNPWLWSMELSYTYLDKNSFSKSVQSNDFRDDDIARPAFPDNSYLAIPFFDAQTGELSSGYIAKPGSFSGQAKLKVTHWMQGAEWNFTSAPALIGCDRLFKIQGLLGFRYWYFNDVLRFTTTSPDLENPNVFTTKDKFTTHNSFYGAQFGFTARFEYCDLFCSLKAKLALGIMDKRLSIKGSLVTNDFNNFAEVVRFQGGYFTQPTNIGHYSKWKFGYLPEVNLNIGYKVSSCPCLTLNAGYTFLYVNKIYWAENQIDPSINPTQSQAFTRQGNATLTGVAKPKALLKSDDFWVQGLSVGLDLMF